MPGRNPLLLGLVVLAVVVLAADLVTAGTWDTSDKGSKPLARPVPVSETTVAPPPSQPSSEPDVNGMVEPPAPGLYRYRTTTPDPKVPSGEIAQQISVEHSAAGVVTDRMFSTDGVDATVAFTGTQELELAYGQVGTSILDEVTCAENPPRVLLQLPLRPGLSWSTSTTCTNIVNDKVRDQRRVTVVGPSTIAVDGTGVSVWELIVVSDLTDIPAAGGAGVHHVVTTTLDIAARYGLIVRRLIQQGTDPTTQQTVTLVSLRPT